MQCLKLIFFLIPAVFSFRWDATNLTSFTIRQAGKERMAFEVQYLNMGKNHSEFSGYFSTGEERTVIIPQGATNIQINTRYTEERPCEYNPMRDYPQKISYPPKICITLYGRCKMSYSSAKNKCEPRPAEGYSITVHQIGDYKSLFELEYDYNDSVETHSSGAILNGQSKTIKIPDGATDIVFSLYEYKSQSSKEKIFKKYFYFPVRKCFNSRDYFTYEDEPSCFEKIN